MMTRKNYNLQDEESGLLKCTLKNLIFIQRPPGNSVKNKQMKEHKQTKSMPKPDRCLKQEHKKG